MLVSTKFGPLHNKPQSDLPLTVHHTVALLGAPARRDDYLERPTVVTTPHMPSVYPLGLGTNRPFPI